jgi:ribonuclease T2
MRLPQRTGGLLLAAVLLAMASACRAREDSSFDYWVLALSWSPEYCAGNPRAANEVQCVRPYAFVVHGLWPQNERGYPDTCAQTPAVGPAIVKRMLPIMPSPGLIQHEWRAHGTCSGLDADAYFRTVERAYRSFSIPAAYRSPAGFNTTPREMEQRFIGANPALKPDGIAVQCSGRYLREVRICLDRKLQPRTCGSDVRDRCGRDMVLRPSR